MKLCKHGNLAVSNLRREFFNHQDKPFFQKYIKLRYYSLFILIYKENKFKTKKFKVKIKHQLVKQDIFQFQ